MKESQLKVGKVSFQCVLLFELALCLVVSLNQGQEQALGAWQNVNRNDLAEFLLALTCGTVSRIPSAPNSCDAKNSLDPCFYGEFISWK